MRRFRGGGRETRAQRAAEDASTGHVFNSFSRMNLWGKGELDFRTIRSRYARLSIKTKLYSND